MPASTEALPRSLRFARFGGAALGLILGVAILCGYGTGLNRAGQALIQNVSLNAPVTAICVVLLSLTGLVRRGSPLFCRFIAQAIIIVVTLLVLSEFSDAVFGTAIIDQVTPFGQIAARQRTACGWTPNFTVGAVMALLLLAGGEGLLLHRRNQTGQIVLCLAAAMFLLQLIGYAARVPPFCQPMSVFFGVAGLSAILAILAGSAGTGVLRALSGPAPYLRWARGLLLGSTAAGLLLGWALARFSGQYANTWLIGEALIFITGIWAVIVAVTLRINRGERIRGEAEGSLRRQADTDSLTGLLSRNKMDELIAERRRAAGRAAMVMIDLDRFRSANNALGADCADSLLQQTAQRLINLAAPHRVARAGGDEFAIFCDNVGEAEANRLGLAVVETVAVPLRLENGREFHITASVGVAHGATEGVKDLRDAADEAMYIAKNQGGNQCVPFLSALHQARAERVGLEQDLHLACRNANELFLVYQPIISLRDRRVVAIEALARWQHPEAGLVPPSRFVAIAEAAGMFLGLGTKLRELAVTQAAEWRDRDIMRMPVINLNVSPLELARSDVPGTLGALIDHYGLQRSSFCLEVTEGSFADEHALQSLRVARDAGFKIAMDDFGVGYSSLTQLPRLPLTSIKLDRSFLDQAMESEDGISLLATMVQLAHVLKLPVVAEGVETPEELNIVSDCGCDSVQGFLFARPLAPAQLEPWLRGDHRIQGRDPASQGRR